MHVRKPAIAVVAVMLGLVAGSQAHGDGSGRMRVGITIVPACEVQRATQPVSAVRVSCTGPVPHRVSSHRAGRPGTAPRHVASVADAEGNGRMVTTVTF
jgi:hypothetical protein